MADFGYGITNFTRIDSTFGSLQDLDEMLVKAKQLGVQILLDFEPNHSSDECIWFQKSVKREADYEDFYMWHDLDRNKLGSQSQQLDKSLHVLHFLGPKV